MNLSCAICCSRLDPSDDIFSTSCGHVFHYPCLTQWLERSKTCPQCRERTSNSKIHRLYFNITANDSIRDDAVLLQERVDNMQFQVLMKDKEISNLKGDANKYKHQTAGLRKEVLKLENELQQKNTAIGALREQAKHFKAASEEAKKYKEQADIFKTKLEDIKDVQMILTSTDSEVDDIITSTDERKLSIYVTVLKRELTKSGENRRVHREQIRKLRDDLMRANGEIDRLREQLKRTANIEGVMTRLETENTELRHRLEEILDTQNIKSNDNETKKDNGKKNSMKTNSQTNILTAKDTNATNSNNNFKSPSQVDDDIDLTLVNPRYKVQNMVPDMKRKLSTLNTGSSLSGNSILSKKPRPAYDPMALTRPRDETYISDGLGGYKKFEEFPTGNKNIIKKKSTVRSNSASGRKPKSQANDLLNRNLDEFVDLT
ncbi:E3 ubiquitin-protein ligase TRAIP-like [Microplitis mediator]|uniref:E3 ubiquitin-protein ligase TRAIP-like n=1 Tax=Microplitis mediator TaxID=375433 RepID=UPI00255354DB|nr:E3 ubiquitin-protein ligase TRAIP-like [Microplitis mediator]